MATVSNDHGFHLSPYRATGNTDEENCCEMFHTFKLSLGSLNLVQRGNRLDFKISKQILPFTF